MLSSISMLARVSATVLAAAACSAAPSPAAHDSVTLSASAPAPAAAGPATPTPPPAAVPSRPDTTRSPVTAPVPSSFTRMLTQRTSGFDEAAELVIRDRAALESAWVRVHNQVQGNPAPAMDFARETVILVALGSRTSGGHSVLIDAVIRSGDGAVVRYTATSPGPGCVTTQSLTSPVDVVRAPRIAGKVRFERHDVVQPC